MILESIEIYTRHNDVVRPRARLRVCLCVWARASNSVHIFINKLRFYPADATWPYSTKNNKNPVIASDADVYETRVWVFHHFQWIFRSFSFLPRILHVNRTCQTQYSVTSSNEAEDEDGGKNSAKCQHVDRNYAVESCVWESHLEQN